MSSSGFAPSRHVLAGSWLACILSAAGAAGGGELPFLSSEAVGALDGADAVVAGDFDADGDLDLAAVGRRSAFGELVWFEDTGAGFVRHPIASLLNEPDDLAAGDLDCDGDLDLVVAVRLSSSVTWYRNEGGASSWNLGGLVGGGSEPRAVAVDDFNGDGRPDVVAALAGSGEIRRWRNDDCSGSAWSSGTVATGLTTPVALATGDLDGDGRVDLAAVDRDQDQVLYWSNLGGGTWIQGILDADFQTAGTVALGDIDGDGRLDVAAAGGPGGQIAWWNLSPSLGAAVATPISTGNGARAIGLADLDRDGDLDLASTSPTAPGRVGWWENAAGDGSSWSFHELDAGAGAVPGLAVGDLGQDGDLDVVAAAADSAELLRYENVSTHRGGLLGEPGSNAYLTTFRETPDWELGDLDGDGRPDLVVVDRTLAQPDGIVHWMRNLGADPGSYVRFGTPFQIESTGFRSFEDVALGDLDQDGDLDALLAGTSNPSESLTSCSNPGPGLPWNCAEVREGYWKVAGVGLGDLDGDGDPDACGAVERNPGDALDLDWWEVVDGDPTWHEHFVADSVPGLSECLPVDLDGDGDLDLATGGNAWWRNAGGQPPTWVAETLPGSAITALDVADVDADGDLDVVAAVTSGGADGLAWFENDLRGPTGVWIERSMRAAVAGTSFQDVALADFDLDGDPDFVVGFSTALAQPGLSWFENDVASSAGPWIERAIPAPLALPVSGHRVLTADLDRDGDPDLLAGRGEFDFASWRNGGGQFALAASAISPPAIGPGSERPVLRLDALHRGRSGEAAMELSAVALRFEEPGGDPLTPTEYAALVESLRLYLDDGSGGFEPALDVEVAAFPSLVPAGGGVLLPLADDVPALQHSPETTPRTYFVTVELTATALEAGIPTVAVTHVPDDGTAAENATFDTPLTREAALPVAATFAVADAAIFADGFESGDTSAWSANVP